MKTPSYSYHLRIITALTVDDFLSIRSVRGLELVRTFSFAVVMLHGILKHAVFTLRSRALAPAMPKLQRISVSKELIIPAGKAQSRNRQAKSAIKVDFRRDNTIGPSAFDTHDFLVDH